MKKNILLIFIISIISFLLGFGCKYMFESRIHPVKDTKMPIVSDIKSATGLISTTQITSTNLSDGQKVLPYTQQIKETPYLKIFDGNAFVGIKLDQLIEKLNSNDSLALVRKEFNLKQYAFKSSSRVAEVATYYSMCRYPEDIPSFFSSWKSDDELMNTLKKSPECSSNLLEAIYNKDGLTDTQKNTLSEKCGVSLAQLEGDFETGSIIMLAYFLKIINKEQALVYLDRGIEIEKVNPQDSKGVYYYRFSDAPALSIYKAYINGTKIDDCNGLFLKTQQIINDQLKTNYIQGK